MTADKLVEDTGSIAPFITQSPAYVAGTPYTFTAYGKEDPTSAKRYLMLLLPLSGFGANIRGVFDLAAGTSTVTGSATVTMDFVGNGWWRCRVTASATASVSAGVQIRLTNVPTGSVAAYTGDGTSGIFIWGAQLSDSASLDPYVYNPGAAPASTAYYGPRFDYDPVTLAPKGLLIEEQRTNSIRNNTGVGAVAGTPGTLPTNWTHTGGGLAANVIGTGVEGGISYIDIQFVGTATTGSSGLRFEGTFGVTAATGQTWNTSVFVRKVAGSTSGLSLLSLNTSYFISSTLSDQGSTTISSASLDEPSISRNRPSVTVAAVAAGITTVRPQVLFSHTTGNSVDITLRIGLPQLELGAFATSPILTTTAAATRAADVAVMTGANFSNWYNQTEGTLFAEYQVTAGTNQRAFTVSDGTLSNVMNILVTNASGNGSSFAVTTAGSLVASVPANLATQSATLYKVAGAYKTDDVNGARNGTVGTTDVSAAIPTVDRAAIGASGATSQFLNGHIRRIAYFPRRLSNAELQGITA
jgi:hypothetical protein